MAWKDNNKNPWNDGGDEPPELEEIVKRLQEKINALFGSNKRSPNTSNNRNPEFKTNSINLLAIIGIIALIWLATGIYIVEPAERGVILRLGSYAGITQPGPHWHIPFPIERIIIVNVDQVSSTRHKAQMLTQDENIVDIELTVQSRIHNPVDYLFQDRTPEKTLQDAIETVVRETIGKSKLDFILTEGRGSVADNIKKGIQTIIDTQYKTGMQVTSVNMQPAKPPEQVKSAFDDAIKAREDKERTENKAHGYANGIVPVARGDAARALADAKAYREKVIAEAKGDAARFLAVLKEYEKAPEITRERMYLGAMQEVLAANDKVIVDIKNSNNIIYLPLDKLNSKNAKLVAPVIENSDSSTSDQNVDTAATRDNNIRTRRERP